MAVAAVCGRLRRDGPKGGRVRLPGPVRLPEEAGGRQVHQSQVRRTGQTRRVPWRDTHGSALKFHRRDVPVSGVVGLNRAPRS